jgi:hypothetical protein
MTYRIFETSRQRPMGGIRALVQERFSLREFYGFPIISLFPEIPCEAVRKLRRPQESWRAAEYFAHFTG